MNEPFMHTVALFCCWIAMQRQTGGLPHIFTALITVVIPFWHFRVTERTHFHHGRNFPPEWDIASCMGGMSLAVVVLATVGRGCANDH
jgi:hypothetical protein